MEPGIWAGDAAGGAGRGVGERPAVVSGFAAGPGIEVAVGVRGGTDRLAFEETSAGSSPFCGPLYRCRLILLKGIGLSRYYPSPLQRECGDIDILLPEGFEKGNEIARCRGMKVSGLDYKHNHICSNGVMFENHRYLTSFKGKSDIRRLERIFQDAVKGGDFVPFGEDGFHTLSPTVNALYITYHGFFHFLIEGITLRHLLDWALFVGKEQNAIDWNYFYRVCGNLGFSRFADTMNAIAVDVWGVSLTNPGVSFDRRCTDRVLADVLANKRHVSGLPVYKRRSKLVCNMLSSRWKYRQLYGRSLFGEMARSVFGLLFDASPELK